MNCRPCYDMNINPVLAEGKKKLNFKGSGHLFIFFFNLLVEIEFLSSVE